MCLDGSSGFALPLGLGRPRLRATSPLLRSGADARTLLDDSIRLAAAAGAADVSVRLAIWPHMIHAWHLFYQEVAGGRRSLTEAGAFIRAHLDDA